MPFCAAWDLLRGSRQMSSEEANEARTRVTTVTSKFFDEYVVNDGMRQLALGVSQNNHPIRTASANSERTCSRRRPT